MRDHTPWPRYRHPRPGSPLTMGSPITDGEWAALNEKIRRMRDGTSAKDVVRDMLKDSLK